MQRGGGGGEEEGNERGGQQSAGTRTRTRSQASWKTRAFGLQLVLLTLALRRRHRSQALLTRRPRGWWWNEDAADGATSDCCGGVDVEAAGEPGWLDAVADSGDVVRAPPPVTAKPVVSTSKYRTRPDGLGGCGEATTAGCTAEGQQPQPQLGATAGAGTGTGTDLTAALPLLLRLLQLSLLILLLAVLWPLWPLWPWLSGGPIAAGGCFLWRFALPLQPPLPFPQALAVSLGYRRNAGRADDVAFPVGNAWLETRGETGIYQRSNTGRKSGQRL